MDIFVCIWLNKIYTVLDISGKTLKVLAYCGYPVDYDMSQFELYNE